jgi:hypothetical protein
MQCVDVQLFWEQPGTWFISNRMQRLLPFPFSPTYPVTEWLSEMQMLANHDTHSAYCYRWSTAADTIVVLCVLAPTCPGKIL